MSQNLVPCPACRRHVHATEATCPFCAVALPSTLAERVIPGITMRVSRAVAFAFGASLGLAGCSTSPSAQAIYGSPSPPLDANADVTDVGAADVGAEVGTPIPHYGAPARTDAGTTDATTGDAVVDTGTFGSAYGSPAPEDGGHP